MGADAFHACYGVRYEIDAAAQSEVTALEKRTDPRQVAARLHDLDQWWGVTNDPDRYYLLIGSMLGQLGHEHENVVAVTIERLQEVAAGVQAKLKKAGLSGEPQLYFQFEPDM